MNTLLTEDFSTAIQVYYLKGNPPFICGVKGVMTLGMMEEIEQDLIDNEQDIFTKGDGDYLFKVTQFDSGDCCDMPQYETEETKFVPLQFESDPVIFDLL